MFGFLKEHGYVWESGLSGHFTYGPMGKSIKNKIENKIRKVFHKEGYSEIETPLISKKEIWVDSGHWDKFTDPIIYTENKKQYRLDKVLENAYINLDYSTLNKEEIIKLLTQLNEKREDKYIINDTIEYKSLMMKTMSGTHECGLRPETATSTYNNFMEMFIHNKREYPVKFFQIGKSFRNEISPEHNIIRGREFTQAEFQIVLPQEDKNKLSKKEYKFQVNVKNNEINALLSVQEFYNEYKLESAYGNLLFLTYNIFLELGIPLEKIRLRRHGDDEKAFYALDAWDVEVKLSELGWTEIAGIHDRGSYDLKKCKMKKIPHILESAIGVDRILYSILDTLYEKKTVNQGKTILKIPYFLAPIDVAVMPLLKNKPDLVKMSIEVYDIISDHFITIHSKTKSIGKRYLNNSMMGIPYSVTIDFESIEDNTVTIRDRDTEIQERIKINDIIVYLRNKI